MVNVRRALGTHSERFGATSAHGKGVYAAADPGKLSLAAMVQVLRVLRDDPERLTGPIDVTYQIAMDEFERCRGQLGDGIVITKSYNLGGVEINYERTWGSGKTGIPIFTNEDRIAGAHVFGQIMGRIGVVLVQSEDGNILLTPGFGTVDRAGRVVEERMRYVVRVLFLIMILLQEWSDEQGSSATAK